MEKGNISPLAIRPDFSSVQKALQVLHRAEMCPLQQHSSLGTWNIPSHSSHVSTGLIFSGLEHKATRADLSDHGLAKWQHFIFGLIWLSLFGSKPQFNSTSPLVFDF